MATNYTPPQFEGGFQSSAQSLGFNPETAVDTSKQEEYRLRKIQEDDAVMASALNRQQALDRGILEGKQTIERAQQKYDQAGAEGNLALLKGLAGFSSTLANTLVNESKKAEQRAEDKEQREYEDARIAPFGTAGGLSESFKKEISDNEDVDYQITAEAQGIGEVAQQLADSGDPNTAYRLNSQSSYNADAPQRLNGQQALATHGAWLLSKVSKLQVQGMSDAQIMAEVATLNSQFSAGVTGGNRRMLLKLADRMDANTANAFSSVFARRNKENNAAASATESANIYAASLSTTDLQQAYNEASAATANGGVDGKYGRSDQTKYRAVDGLINNLVARGEVDAIEQLKFVQGVPGQSGTELGFDKRFAPLFAKAEKDALKMKISDFDLEQKEKQLKISQLSRLYLDDPTTENKQKAVTGLRAIGSKEADDSADQISGVGLGIDEGLEADIKLDAKAGDHKTKAELQQLVQQGRIPPEMLQYSKEQANPGTIAAAEYTKPFKADIKSGLLNNVYMGDAKAAALTTEQTKLFKPYVANRSAVFQAELNQKLGAIITANGGGEQGLKAAQSAYNQVLTQLMADPRFRIQTNSVGEFIKFGAPLSGDIEQLVVMKGRVTQYSETTPERLAELRSQDMEAVQTTRDILMTPEGLKADALAMANGQNVSARTSAIAQALGLSSRELVENQLKRYQMPTLQSLTNKEYAAERLARIRAGSPPDTRETMGEFQSYGVPKKASAQLARLSQVNNPGSLPSISKTQRDVLNRIAAQESRGSGDYDAMNKGSYDAEGRNPIDPGTGTQNFGKPLTSMTVGEILQEGAEGDIHAAGRYQFIHSTLKEQVERLGIPLDTKYDERVQDYMTLAYMRQNPEAWIGINDKDPGALAAMYEVSKEPLPPAPWLNPEISPQQLMDNLKASDSRAFYTIMNPQSSPNQVRAAIISGFGRQAGSISTAPKRVYTTGNLGYGSTGDHVDIKPVSPGKVLANRNLPITRSELDQYVAVGTANGLKPLSQAMTMTASDQDHRDRARSSHGIDFAAEPNRELYLTNGARVIENYIDNSARGQGSHRLLIEVPGGKRYAFIHGTSNIKSIN